MEIIVTGISLDDKKVSLPAGLSELLNSAGAWGRKKEADLLNQYERKVIFRNGHYVTQLTKKEDAE